MSIVINSIQYEAPSNIALVKYWGKYGVQLPSNPSISFTLTECKSIFSINLLEKKNTESSVKLFFEGEGNDKFASKIKLYFNKIANQYPIVNQYDWEIESSNTFPHSSGIASSASSMAALAMCIDELQHHSIDYHRVSSLARIGSGSASRSVIEKIAWWGQHDSIPTSNNEYAVPVWYEINPIFHTYQNTILIASSGEKPVSSSLGHQLMNNHSYAQQRYTNANTNILDLFKAMQHGDLEKFGEIVEYEALSLHALMMMSKPSFILMKPNSLLMIEKVREYRESSKVPIYFTLDAGPNLHVLFPEKYKDRVDDFIQNELTPFCENGVNIKDKVGHGPKKIN